MELRQLRYFAAIVEHGNMTRAADALHVAQPALSQQLANLEAELRGRLFERGPQGMRVTAAGTMTLLVTPLAAPSIPMVCERPISPALATL